MVSWLVQHQRGIRFWVEVTIPMKDEHVLESEMNGKDQGVHVEPWSVENGRMMMKKLATKKFSFFLSFITLSWPRALE